MVAEISNSNKVRIAENPISNRLVASIGFQADCFIYDELNSQCGVNNDDYAWLEPRIKAMRPGIAQIFYALQYNQFNDFL